MSRFGISALGATPVPPDQQYWQDTVDIPKGTTLPFEGDPARH